MRRLVLHIGTHKTGTTSIQQFLEAAGDEVAALTGLRYLPPQRRRFPPTDARVLDPATLRRDGANVPSDYLRHVCSGTADTLVVEENLSWTFGEAQIGAMLRHVQSHFSDIRVIAYVRRQDLQLLSHHQQGSRFRLTETNFYGRSPTAVPPHAQHHDGYLDHHARLLPYVERLGAERLTVRVFEREALTGGDVITDFLGLLGVDRSRLATDHEVFENQSRGKTVTKLGHLYNRLPDRRIYSGRMAQFLPDDPKLTLARRDATVIAERYADSNDRLARLLTLPRFSTDFSGYPEESTSDWCAEEIGPALDGLRRLTRRIAKRTGLDIARGGVFPDEIRELRGRAELGTIPAEDEINRLLVLALARLNAVALGRPDWADAVPPG